MSDPTTRALEAAKALAAMCLSYQFTREDLFDIAPATLAVIQEAQEARGETHGDGS